MADALEKITEAVPTLYYDLIARFAPGAASLGTYLWLSGLTLHEVERFTHLSGGAFIALLIGSSYLIGLLLTPLGGIPEYLLHLVAMKVSAVKHYSPAWIWRCVDEVALRNETAAAVFGKMAAEVTLCENLLAGVIVAVVVNWRNVDKQLTLLCVALLALNVALRMVVFVRRLERVAQRLGVRILDTPTYAVSGAIETEIANV